MACPTGLHRDEPHGCGNGAESARRSTGASVPSFRRCPPARRVPPAAGGFDKHDAAGYRSRPNDRSEVAMTLRVQGQAWMHSPAFDRNPIGVEYDPDELLRKFRAGVPVAELVVRD